MLETNTVINLCCCLKSNQKTAVGHYPITRWALKLYRLFRNSSGSGSVILAVGLCKQVFKVTLFALLVPVGMLLLYLGIEGVEGDLLVCGIDWIRACLRNVRELACL